MDADQRRKNDEHPQGKGGETKLLRRGQQGTRNLFDRVGRGEHTAWIILSAEEQTQFSKAIETEWQGVLDFKAVTIIDSTQADVIREKQCERVISSRFVLRWKETDTGYKANARWCVHSFNHPDILEIERSCPTPELSSINITLQIPASTASEETLADGEKAFMQGDPIVRDEPLYATPPPEGLPGVPEGALIRLDREVYGLVSGMSGWRSRIVSQLKEEGYEMNVQ